MGGIGTSSKRGFPGGVETKSKTAFSGRLAGLIERKCRFWD
jgi:hypothetical protein